MQQWSTLGVITVQLQFSLPVATVAVFELPKYAYPLARGCRAPCFVPAGCLPAKKGAFSLAESLLSRRRDEETYKKGPCTGQSDSYQIAKNGR